MNILQHVLEYHKRGWSIIPVKQGTKKAATAWKRYQLQPADEDQLRKWFPKHSSAAVILGAVSGNLACRDYDVPGSYEQWQKAHEHLADTLPTVKTARGYHVYFTSPDTKTTHDETGEIRGEGCYCLVPPSIHPNGDQYRWIVPITTPPPLIDPVVFGKPRLEQKRTEESRREQNERTEENGSHVGGSAISREIQDEAQMIESAIEDTLPAATGMRNNQIFMLARRLKAIDPTMPRVKQRKAVLQWHTRALPHISTKPYEDTWADFIYGWNRVRKPLDCNYMTGVLHRAESYKVKALDYEEQALQLLVKICHVLQEDAGADPFYLSARMAGNMIGMDHNKAWRYMSLLKEDGWLDVVHRGDRHHASRYRLKNFQSSQE